MFAQVFWCSEDSGAMVASLVHCGTQVHGGDVFLQVVEVTDHFCAVWATLRNFSRAQGRGGRRGRGRRYCIVTRALTYDHLHRSSTTITRQPTTCNIQTIQRYSRAQVFPPPLPLRSLIPSSTKIFLHYNCSLFAYYIGGQHSLGCENAGKRVSFESLGNKKKNKTSRKIFQNKNTFFEH